MPRRVEDIIPSNRRSIRDMPVEHESAPAPQGKNSSKSRNKIDEVGQVISPNDKKRFGIPVHKLPDAVGHERHAARPQKRRPKWPFIAGGVIVILVVSGFTASSYLSKATFTIIPRVVNLNIDGTFVAKGASNTNNGLAYSLVTVAGTASTTIPATDGPYTSTKAEGKIAVFDYYSGKPQRLIAGTRFSDSGGRVYRLTSSVVVPGAVSSSTPGKTDAEVIADQTGQSYNISLTDSVGNLKIVAYKGITKYDTIFARLATGIAGGYEGVKKTVSPAAIASTTAYLKTELTASLLNQVKKSIPNGYIMFDNAYAFNFGSPIIGGEDQNQATMSMAGTAYGVIFDSKAFAAQMAGSKAQVFGGFGYDAPDLGALSFNIANAKDFDPADKGTLVFVVKGNLKLVGVVPVDEIKKKLAGLSLAQTQSVIRPYNAVIESGSGELVPPWSKVPTDVNRISVIVENP